MGFREFLVHLYLKNHAKVVSFLYLNFAPPNLYPSLKKVFFFLKAQLIKILQDKTNPSKKPVFGKFLDTTCPLAVFFFSKYVKNFQYFLYVHCSRSFWHYSKFSYLVLFCLQCFGCQSKANQRHNNDLCTIVIGNGNWPSLFPIFEIGMEYTITKFWDWEWEWRTQFQTFWIGNGIKKYNF